MILKLKFVVESRNSHEKGKAIFIYYLYIYVYNINMKNKIIKIHIPKLYQKILIIRK